MTNRKSWIAIVLGALCAAAAGFWVAGKLDRSGPELASGTWLPQGRILSDFHLTDDGGKAFTFSQLQGHPSLVFFGFTHCPDVCPATLLKLAQVKKTAGLAGLQVVLVTIDPQRDTPALLTQYVHAFDPSFIGLTGDTETINKMAAEFGVAVARVDLPGGDYTMDHSAVVFLLDAHAHEVGLFTPPFDVQKFARDLRTAEPQLEARS